MAESYIAGWWDTDDLTGLIRLLIDRLRGPMGLLDDVARRAARPLAWARRARRPSPAADRRNVAAHYDLPGQLFEVMLDESMSYSCAVFEPPGVTLAQAQRIKLDRLCDKLALGPDDHLVEIGTGWGGLAIHAATRTGCRVTTTTLSEAQLEVATRRVHEAGLADRVTVLGRDYRELEGTYDKLVSVEMIEAVDWRLYPTFFATCRRLLAPDGVMALQAITIADRSFERATLHEDFARAMVFPGGCLPSLTALLGAVTDATDLVLVDLEDIGRHYPTTLARWWENVDARWDRLATAGFDEEFRRLWHFYLAYCEAAFLERRISDVQMVLAGPRWRPDGPGGPIRRDR
jgi:cyclopropane-fatty-acyl-phospholipid synthase